ncbi:MAG: TonB family protein [Pseudomonadota bacterium]
MATGAGDLPADVSGPAGPQRLLPTGAGKNRFLARSLLISAALHLAVLALVTPHAHWGGPEMRVIQARIMQPATPADSPQDSLPPPPEEAPAVEPLISPEPTPVTVPATAPEPLPPPATQADEVASVAPGPATPSAHFPEDQPAQTEPAAQALGLPSPVDTTWYLARDVDTHPREAAPIQPIYPDRARQLGKEGTLKLKVRIDALGQVVDVEVVEAEPAGLFEESALEAFRNARFHPAIRQGRFVRYEAYIRVEFRLDTPEEVAQQSTQQQAP